MADPAVIKEIQEAVTIPVMAKARIGHFAEAQVLQSLEVDYVDESEVLTPADEANHIDKHAFEVPFVCGATNLGEALRRIGEGAAMIRSKGEAGTGNIVEAVRHLREIVGGIKRLGTLRSEQLAGAAKELGAPLEVVAGGRRARLAAGAAVLRRRHRHPGRRGADDAARRRGQLRRLRDLQVARTPSGAPARSSRRPPTSTTPSGSPRPRWSSASRCAATTSPSSRPTASCCSSAALSCRGPSAAEDLSRAGAADRRARAARATSRPIARMLESLGAERDRGADPGRARRPRRAGDPRRRVHHDHEGDRARRPRAGDPRPRRAGGRSSGPAPG